MRPFSLISLLITVAAYHFKNDTVTSTPEQVTGSLTENIMRATNNLNMTCLEWSGLPSVGYLSCGKNNRLSFIIRETRAIRTVSISNAARLTCKVPDCSVQGTSQTKPTDAWTTSKQPATYHGIISYITASSNHKIIYGVGAARGTCQFVKFNLNNNTTSIATVHDLQDGRQLCGLTAGPCTYGVATCIFLCSYSPHTQHRYTYGPEFTSRTVEFEEPDLAVQGKVPFERFSAKIRSISIDNDKQMYTVIRRGIQPFLLRKRLFSSFWSDGRLMPKEHFQTLEIMKSTSKVISTKLDKIEICQYLQKSSRSFCRKPIVYRKLMSDVVCWLDPTNVITINRKFPYNKKIISM